MGGRSSKWVCVCVPDSRVLTVHEQNEQWLISRAFWCVGEGWVF